MQFLSKIIPVLMAFAGVWVAPAMAQAMTPGTVFSDCDDCPEMVVIPSGSFRMGNTVGGEHIDEFDGHEVTIANNFAVSRYEVTFAEWDACVADGGCRGYSPSDYDWGRGNRPVINVSWEDAYRYIDWLSTKTGQTYRFLSESEWEYAARAGTSTAYPWGDTESREHMNFGNGSGVGLAQGSDQWFNTSPVGSFPPNAFGLYDMNGNVSEWVQDCWHDTSQGTPPNDGSEWGPWECPWRVTRGGSWGSHLEFTRSSARNRWSNDGVYFSDDWSDRDNEMGIRLARTLKSDEQAAEIDDDEIPPEVTSGIDAQIAAAEAELQRAQSVLDDARGGYAPDEVPPGLRHQLRGLEHQVLAAQNSLDLAKQERSAIVESYLRDKPE